MVMLAAKGTTAPSQKVIREPLRRGAVKSAELQRQDRDRCGGSCCEFLLMWRESYRTGFPLFQFCLPGYHRDQRHPNPQQLHVERQLHPHRITFRINPDEVKPHETSHQGAYQQNAVYSKFTRSDQEARNVSGGSLLFSCPDT